MDIVHDKETGGDDDQRRLLGRCGIPVKSGNGLLSPPPPPDDDDEQNHNRNQKKQVRRRLHTSRPYQERLLNMAEARREIVAALKFHRATMKQSSSSSNRRQQQQQETNLHIPNNLPPPQPQQPTSEEEMNQAYYSSHHTQTSSGNSCGSINSCCSYFLQQQQQQQPNSGCSYLWPSSSSSSSSSSSQFGYSPFPFSTDVDILHDFPLPNQTLGLNLNFHQFANLETPVCRKFVSPQWQAVVQDHEVKANPVVTMDHVKMNSMTPVYQESDEQKSGWWYKRFKSTMEPEQEPDCNYMFDETVNGVDVPYWLSSEEESCFHEIDHTISQDHLLPSMDIGEIETIDGDWLS